MLCLAGFKTLKGVSVPNSFGISAEKDLRSNKWSLTRLSIVTTKNKMLLL